MKTVDPHFPRMMFHRTKDPVTVYSQEELDLLNPSEWSKTLFTAPEPEALPEPDHREPESIVVDAEAEPEPPPVHPERPAAAPKPAANPPKHAPPPPPPPPHRKTAKK